MKKKTLAYLRKLAVQDFLGCVTSEQLQNFKKLWPGLDMESTKGKNAVTLDVEIEILTKFMEENKLGCFREQPGEPKG